MILDCVLSHVLAGLQILARARSRAPPLESWSTTAQVLRRGRTQRPAAIMQDPWPCAMCGGTMRLLVLAAAFASTAASRTNGHAPASAVKPDAGELYQLFGCGSHTCSAGPWEPKGTPATYRIPAL